MTCELCLGHRPDRASTVTVLAALLADAVEDEGEDTDRGMGTGN